MLNTILENKVVVCNYVLDIIHSQACKMIPDDTKLAKSNKAAISQLGVASRYSQARNILMSAYLQKALVL